MQRSPQALDQEKAGLQDDHDPTDIGQRQASETGGVRSIRAEKSAPKKTKPEE
jgi:hypothetical protein